MRKKKRTPVLRNAADDAGLSADLEAISESFGVLADTDAPAKTEDDRSRHLEKTWSLTAQSRDNHRSSRSSSRALRGNDRPFGEVTVMLLAGLFELLTRPGTGYGHYRWTATQLIWLPRDVIGGILSTSFLIMFCLFVVRLARSQLHWVRSTTVLVTALFASISAIIAVSAWSDYDPCKQAYWGCHPAFYWYVVAAAVYASALAASVSILMHRTAGLRAAIIAVSLLAVLVLMTLVFAVMTANDSAVPSRAGIAIWATFTSSAAIGVLLASLFSRRHSRANRATCPK